VTIEVAVTVEFPAPVRVVVLGRLQALLPDEKEPIVRSLSSSVRRFAFEFSERRWPPWAC
jgi:hypothetical protein